MPTYIALALYALGIVGALLIALYMAENDGTGEITRAQYMTRVTVLAFMWPGGVLFVVGMTLLTRTAPDAALRVRRWILTGAM